MTDLFFESQVQLQAVSHQCIASRYRVDNMYLKLGITVLESFKQKKYKLIAIQVPALVRPALPDL